MIHEAIEKLQKLADEARMPQVVHLPGEPSHHYHLVRPDGTVEAMEAQPGNRSIELESLSDLVAMAGDQHFDETVASDAARQIITLSTALQPGGYQPQVRLWFDSSTMREYAYVPLTPTAEVAFMLKRIADPTIEVRDLRQALTTTLAETFEDTHLVRQISSLEFTNEDRARIASDRGRESMGRSIEEHVDADQPMPEPVQPFRVRAFQNHDLDVRFPLNVRLDPDPRTRRWWFQPIEASWIDFEARVLAHVRGMIESGLGDDSQVRVYHGRASIGSNPPAFTVNAQQYTRREIGGE